MTIRDLAFGLPGGAEKLLDSARRGRIRSEQAPHIHVIGVIFGVSERAQIDAWFAIRREAHHFPFVAVRHETQILRELRVEEAE